MVTYLPWVASRTSIDSLLDGYDDLKILHSRFASNCPKDADGGQRQQPRKLRASREATCPLTFFDHLTKHKGLELLIEAVELLRSEGIEIKLGVAGSGNLGQNEQRLRALDAEVINRWISDDEVGSILARYDAMACSHVEASQSGVAATAFGNCMPVIAMPVGGISEQVIDGRTGVLSRRMSARAFADATYRLTSDEKLYESISRNLSNTGFDRSMERFLSDILSETMSAKEPAAARVPDPRGPEVEVKSDHS
jgi:glycosyltransferase involved in cell wall biosynthesis